MVTEFAEIEIIPGKEQDFIAGVEANRAVFTRAAGCHGAELHRSMAVQEVRSAGADTGKFLSDIAEENPTMRTVQQDVGAIWNAAENVYNATRQAASQVGPAIEEGVETVEKACEGGPACIP